jgi:hypothetical protein
MLADGKCGIPTSKEGKKIIKRFRVSYMKYTQLVPYLKYRSF